MGIWKMLPVTIWWYIWRERERERERERATDGFLRAKFHPFKFQALFFWNVVQLKLNAQWDSKVALLDFVDKIMHESLRV